MRRVGVLGTGFRPAPDGAVPAEIARAASPDIRPELHELRLAVFPATPAERERTALGYVDAGLAAAAAGCEAVFINTVGDYGIADLRGLLDVPVVGAGEAVLAAARQVGRRFGILTVWPPALDFIYETVLAESDLSAYCTGIYHLSDDADLATLTDDENFVTELRGAADERLRAAALQAKRAKRDGARAIVIGCTCMAPVAGRLADVIGLPVLDAMTVGYRAAEFALRAGLVADRDAWGPPALDSAGVRAAVDAALAAEAAVPANFDPCSATID